MEIPSQYKATIDLQLLGTREGIAQRIILPPPIKACASSSASTCAGSTNCNHSAGVYQSAPPSYSSIEDNQSCRSQAKNLAFDCGHQTCSDCGKDLQVCPLCRRHITPRIGIC